LIEAYRLNGSAPLVMAAQRCGSQILDDAERFDERFRRGRLASVDGAVLDLVCRIVKAARNCVRQHRIENFQLEKHIGQNCLNGKSFGPDYRQLGFHRLHADGGPDLGMDGGR
jgi:hypothetical protein